MRVTEKSTVLNSYLAEEEKNNSLFMQKIQYVNTHVHNHICTHTHKASLQTYLNEKYWKQPRCVSRRILNKLCKKKKKKKQTICDIKTN